MHKTGRRLFRDGMFLFFLGLVTGLVEQKITNPRRGLAAHLKGVFNGIFLVAVWAEHLPLPANKLLAITVALRYYFKSPPCSKRRKPVLRMWSLCFGCCT